MSKRKVRGYGKRIDAGAVVKGIIFSLMLVVCAPIQVSFFKVFGVVPAVVLSLVCAIGFVCGEMLGCICGIIGGTFLDIIGSEGISLSPLLFMLAGFFCGYLLKIFLRKNFVSFMVYSAAVGAARACITLGYFALKASSFSIIDIFTGTIFPELAAFILLAPVSYFLCTGISRLTDRICGGHKK